MELSFIDVITFGMFVLALLTYIEKRK
ncbi:putative holin-like toxin [Paenibacillus sp. CECT 9249]